MARSLCLPKDGVTEGIGEATLLCDEPCIFCADPVRRSDVAANRITYVPQRASTPRFRSFWPLQLGGWLLYAVSMAASLIPLRNMRDEVAYKVMSLLTAFLCSFVMYLVCHALWRARVPLFRALSMCTVSAYGLGVLCAAASLWSEIRFGGVHLHFRWSYAFAFATGSCVVLLAWSFLYFGIKHYDALVEERARLLASESLARQAQLRALRYQLQPHFLFNTLNAISTLVLDNQPRLATQMISRLADLLRSTLESPDVHQVSLAEEITVTQEYLALEKIRFGPRLAVTFDIATETQTAQVPRFLLQPLVENAIRHGIAKRQEGGAVVLRSDTSLARLRICIRNDGAEPDASAHRRTTTHRGVGLTNTRARLEQLYGYEATLETRTTPDGSYEVWITMPLSTAETMPELHAAVMP